MSSSLPSDFDILESLDYVDRDFDTIYERLLDLATSVWPTWARLKASWDNFMLGMVAHSSDSVHFYRDNRVRENFLRTAKMRESVIMLGELVEYLLSGPSAATADVTLTLTSGDTAGSVTIPAGSIASTVGGNKINFQLLADVVIAAGLTTGSGAVEHSTTRVEERTSDGSADQRYILAYTSFLDDSMAIEAANGTYTKVNNFFSSTATSLHFKLTMDTKGKPIVQFGDGAQGEVPQGTIEFTYKTGGGVIGRVEADTITRLNGSFIDSYGSPVTVGITNPAEATGGLDMESIPHAKKSIPASRGNVRTTVSDTDYKNNAELVTGVARATVITADQNPAVPENTGNLYVAALGTAYESGYVPPAEPSFTLLAAVQTMIESTRPNTITFETNYLPVSFEDIDHVVTVYFDQGYSPSTVAAAMLVSLQNFYSMVDADGEQLDSSQFGYEYKDVDGDSTGELPWSDVFDVLRDTEGVRKIEAAGGLYLNGLSAGVQLGNIKMPRLQSLIVIDGDTGSTVS